MRKASVSLISQLTWKAKITFGGGVLLITASLPGVGYAESASGRYVFAEVLVAGIAIDGPRKGYNKTSKVYLDVVTVPSEITWKRGSEYFSPGEPNSLSEIHARALSFVKSHEEELGIERIGHYQIRIHPQPLENRPSSSLEEVQKLKAEEFSAAAPGNTHVEFHGVWMGKKAEFRNGSPSVLKTKPSPVGEPVLLLNRTNTSTEDAKRSHVEAEAKKKADEEHKENVAAAKKRASDEAAAKASKEERHKQWCMADQARLSYCGCSQYNPVKGGACLK